MPKLAIRENFYIFLLGFRTGGPGPSHWGLGHTEEPQAADLALTQNCVDLAYSFIRVVHYASLMTPYNWMNTLHQVMMMNTKANVQI